MTKLFILLSVLCAVDVQSAENMINFPEVKSSFREIDHCKEKTDKLLSIFARLTTAIQTASLVSSQRNFTLYTECGDFPFEELDAHSVGDDVSIDVKMSDVFKTDDELAFVLAHELSHSILGHDANRESALLNRKAISKREYHSLAKADELDADQLGLKILQMANYRPGAAVEALKNFQKVLTLTTRALLPLLTDHPSFRKRKSALRFELKGL